MADNITHGLAAALLAQAGLRQRYGALATAALVVGSELPDLDALFELGGTVFGFVHHRGITHSLLGGAGLALLGAALLWSVWRSHPYWRVTVAGVSWGAPAHRDGLPDVLRHADFPAIFYRPLYG